MSQIPDGDPGFMYAYISQPSPSDKRTAATKGIITVVMLTVDFLLTETGI